MFLVTISEDSFVSKDKIGVDTTLFGVLQVQRKTWSDGRLAEDEAERNEILNSQEKEEKELLVEAGGGADRSY